MKINRCAPFFLFAIFPNIFLLHVFSKPYINYQFPDNPPVDCCFDEKTHGGIEYIVWDAARIYLNYSENDFITKCEINIHRLFENTTHMMLYSATILADRLHYMNFSQPTFNSGISLIAAYHRIPWLFVQNMNWDAAISIFLIPIVISFFFWYFEQPSNSTLFLHFFEMIGSYFYMQEGKFRNLPSKILQIMFLSFVLVFISIYLSTLVKNYRNEKTFDGLLDPGGYRNKKINGYMPYSSMLLNLGIVIIPEYYYDYNEIQALLNNGTIKYYLYDNELLDIVVQENCHIYMLIENIQRFYFGSIFGTSVDYNTIRRWNEGIVHAIKQYTKSDLINYYHELPHHEINPCLKKKKLNFFVYMLEDFYELWIIYSGGVVCGAFAMIYDYYVNYSKKKEKKFVGKNWIYISREEVLSKNFFNLFKYALCTSSQFLRLFNKEIILKIQENFVYKKIKKLESFKSQISLAKKKTLIKSSKLKIYKSRFEILLKCSKYKKIKMKPSVATVFESYFDPCRLKYRKFCLFINALILQNFMDILFKHNLVHTQFQNIRIEESTANYFTIYLPFTTIKNKYIFPNLTFLTINNIVNWKCMIYLNPILENIKNCKNLDLINDQINEILQDYTVCKGQSPIKVIYLIKKKLSKILTINKKHLHNIQTALANGFWNSLNNDGCIPPKAFNTLKLNQQKRIACLLRRINYKSTIVEINRGSLVMQLPDTTKIIVPLKQKIIQKKKLASENPVISLKFNCNNLKQFQ